MPKKYHQKSLLTKPQPSSAPSLLSSRPSSASHQTEPSQRSVNDLIRESRRSQLRNEAQRNPATPSVTTSSVPPSVRAVLDLPPLPPPPEPRRALGPARTRRIPGPPPPRSWLVHSIHAPPDKYHKSSSVIVDGDGRRLQVRTSTLPGASFPPAASLQHLVLTKIASHWSWHALNDADWLPSLPSNLKQTLLSYLSVYNDSPINPIRLLFPEDVPIQDNDRDEIQRLDMGNALGLWTSMKGLERDLFTKNLSSSKPETSQAKSSPATTPDHWNADQEDSDEYSATSLVGLGTGFSPKTRHSFVNLKHLSLAISPSNVKAASWASLLTVAGELGTLTSLSLAYWPQPTFTPNAASTRVTVRAFGQSVVYGGSNMYTAHDDDWREAAGILRTLSRSLYCLRWLDLTGCGDWYAALLWSPQTMALGESSATAERIGPEWNGGWRGLDKLVLQAGWTPVPPPLPSSSSSSPPSSTADASTQQPDEPAWNVEHERMIYRYNQERQRLTEIHTRAREVANTLRRIRKGAGGKWIEVDCGDSPTLSD